MVEVDISKPTLLPKTELVRRGTTLFLVICWDLRLSQQKIYANINHTTLFCSGQRLRHRADQLTCSTDIRIGVALTQLYSLLRNERFDTWLLMELMLRLSGGRLGILAGVGLDTLAITLLGLSRPVYVEAYSRGEAKGRIIASEAIPTTQPLNDYS